MAEVALGWTVDESGRLRRETVHSMKWRCRDWDYRTRCIYMITVELAVALPWLGASVTGRFAALGNRFLLRRPLAQVQVSRSFFRYRRVPKPGGGLKIFRDAKGEPVAELETAEYRERKADLFAAAKHGAVLLSPCVSDGERQIAHEALSAKLKLITMANKGVSKLQKPSGRCFDARAEGRLLMLAL